MTSSERLEPEVSCVSLVRALSPSVMKLKNVQDGC